MALANLNRRGFLKIGLGALASPALTGGKKTQAEEPNKKPQLSAPPTMHLSEFNKLKDKTLNKANELFSDIESWKSLPEKEKKDFCIRVLKTLAKDKNQSTENLINDFLSNLNHNLRSDRFTEDQKSIIFKLNNYMMLGLGFLSIRKRSPNEQTAKLFLSDIILASGTPNPTKNPIQPVSLGQELYESTQEGEKLLNTFVSIRNKHFNLLK
jgi:hypothetical protein